VKIGMATLLFNKEGEAARSSFAMPYRWVVVPDGRWVTVPRDLQPRHTSIVSTWAVVPSARVAARRCSARPTVAFLRLATPRKGGVALLHRVAVLIGDATSQYEHIGPEGLPQRVDAKVAGQLIAGLDGSNELQTLRGLDDLLVLDRDVRVREERHLGLVSENRGERQWSQNRVMPQVAGGVFVEVRAILVLGRSGVLANLFPTDHVVIGMGVRQADDVR
jgi:hypothetical protein